jgi:hypothetical protein
MSDMHLTRDDSERIATALMVYKRSLDLSEECDLYDYNVVEIVETDALAIKLDLVGDYYELGKDFPFIYD